MDYTWEINTKDFQFGTQRGYITRADIDAFVKELMDTYECTATHPTKDTWYLTDLSFSDYEDLERNYWKEVGYYISAKSENVNSSKRCAKMIKRANNLNSATNAKFDERAFDKYLDSLVDDCLEAIMEQGVYAEELETKIPSYNSDWCAAELTIPMNKAINKMKPIIREYYRALYLGNK